MSAARRPGRLPWLRRLLDLAIIVLIIVALGCGWLYWYIRRTQPDLDGTVPLAALDAPVSITRDTLGVPHIVAGDLHDLFVAQGFAMAQDRLWQMDLLRRAAAGRLSEVFGPATLAADRRTRTLGLDRVAAAEAIRLPAQDRALLEAFATGVNLNIIRRGRRDLPLEFWLLRYRPALWQPQDSLGIAAYMFETLGSAYQDKLERESFAAQLPPEVIRVLFPDHSPWDIVPGAPLPADLAPALSGTRAASGQGTSAASSLEAARNAAASLPVYAAPYSQWPDAGHQPLGGSNNWALDGARSFSGKPILANDPHLEYRVPGLWWTAGLSAPGYHVAGVAITGIPGIIIGHNDQIAWGLTNVGADVQDLYRENLDGKGNVQTATGWQPLEVRHEVIHVKGAPDTTFDVKVTPHGPIIAHDAGGPLALAWTLYVPGALAASHVFLQVGQAHDWASFEAALAGFAGPAQNFVYADTAGHIGYQCAGWVPIRSGSASGGDGTVPVPGNTAQYAWRGMIPFADLPRVYDPAAGILATANGRIAPDALPFPISHNWDAPNRTRRIYQLLESLPQWNASAMGRLQVDVFSEQDRDFAQSLLAAVRNETAAGRPPGAAAQQAARLLRGFRGAMGRTSPGPTLAVETRDEFLRRVLAARMPLGLARQYSWNESPVLVQALLAARPPAWLPAAYQATGWDAFLVDCLNAVALRQPLTVGALHWGQFEILDVPHPLWSHISFFDRYADLGPVEINGSPLTVKQARNTRLGDSQDLGPSMRMVADLADWDRSTLTLFAGESGDIFSSHYRDQFSAYLTGRALPLWFTPAAIAAHAEHQLRLIP